MSGSTLLVPDQRGALMNSFYEHHKDSIRWHYRCFDRILLNGLIQPIQQLERDQRGALMNSFYEHHKDSIRWQTPTGGYTL